LIQAFPVVLLCQPIGTGTGIGIGIGINFV
jgi:hypothetical protein